MNKPNRAHYRIDQSFMQDGWSPSGDYLCVFHARRLPRYSGYRAVAMKTSRFGMSRPTEQLCSECLKHSQRCEHDAQNDTCPCIPGDTCGRDSDTELGGSW